uniref:Secreted protein n=1 Tax=Pectinophora gossypiella TaxID=13191 RepID=A0A1E1W0R8_PECGO
MNLKYRIMFIVFLVPQCVWSNGHCPNLKTDVKSIRKRRHLVFPDGSNFVLTMDFAKTFLTHVPSGWFVTMDLDVVYLLPDKKFISSHLRRKLHHRQKRELWERIRDALNLHNMNGHACILRSICEAKTHLAPPGKSLVHGRTQSHFHGTPRREGVCRGNGRHLQRFIRP